ncbi:tripartite tricarboxylate transporter permease [Jiangella asiatica]|uniref:Tripartite tricarboxylate transporter permease n=1 Tax=Jiangella asiatica TaxID=2530372 RepID=A0A4R5DLR5_9ACTN|nr:tripartite tricarboxylate transporter permease [Jiangella asiatica]TDE11815.1 tripartite tricarboxylate transporter permease [Jiangella asiatica]
MDALDPVIGGFQTALSLHNLLFCAVGVILGTVIGLLPGLGSATGVALLMPLTLGLEPVTALIMLAGLYYGTQYGGTISSVLVSSPGEASTVVSTFDGYQMARQGRAGQALAIAAIASFVAGTLTIVLLMALAPVFAGIAVDFGPPEMVGLVVVGLVGVVGLSRGIQMLKGLAMGALGVAVATIGFDPQTAVQRFTFGSVEVLGGIQFVPVVIGLFAIAEVMSQARATPADPIRARFRDLLLTRDDLHRSRAPIGRGTVLGFFLGTLPGAGATIASFVTYDVEKRVSKRKHEFGKGAIEGVAGPEAANNAAVNGAFVPTLTLGIPGSGTTAVLLGAFLLFGIQPGPLLMDKEPDLVWGLMASFYVGNVLLLILNLPMAPIFASMLRVRYAVLYPVILSASLLGAYALENRMWGAWVAVGAALVGYFLKRYDFPPAPVILGLILGPMLEQSLNQTSSMGSGDFGIFLHRPIALALLALSVAILLVPTIVARLRGPRSGAERQLIDD